MKVPAAVPGWAAAEWCGCAAVDWAGDATCRCLRVCPVPTVTMVLPVTDIHTPMFHIIMWGLCSCLCCFRQNHFEMIGSKYLLNILLLVFQKTTCSNRKRNLSNNESVEDWKRFDSRYIIMIFTLVLGLLLFILLLHIILECLTLYNRQVTFIFSSTLALCFQFFD